MFENIAVNILGVYNPKRDKKYIFNNYFIKSKNNTK